MTRKDIERQRLSERLKEYRKTAGLSQKELAERLGKAQTVISSWEIGTGEPNASQLPAVAKALGVTLSDICGSPDAKSLDQEVLDAYHRADKITKRNVRLLLGLNDIEYNINIKGSDEHIDM